MKPTQRWPALPTCLALTQLTSNAAHDEPTRPSQMTPPQNGSSKGIVLSAQNLAAAARWCSEQLHPRVRCIFTSLHSQPRFKRVRNRQPDVLPANEFAVSAIHWS